MKFVKRDKKTIFYKTTDIGAISDKTLTEVKWPAEIGNLKILLGKDTLGAHKTLKENVSRNYLVRLCYSAAKSKLRVAAPRRITPGITLDLLSNEDTAKALFIKTQSQFFLVPWAEYIDHQYLSDFSVFVRDFLPKAETVVASKSGEPVSLLTLFDQGKGKSLIAWIWISSLLTKAERQTVHYKLMSWVRKNSSRHIVAAVHSFNTRSNIFFEKAGFAPSYIWVTRKP